LFLAGGYTGVRLWDKLVGYYFNYIDYDVAHDFKINFESRYKLYEEEPKTAESDFSIKQLKSSSINLVSQGKNSNQASILSQIRNIENIIYVNQEDLKKCRNTLELQVLIDSVVPEKKAETPNHKVHKMQKELSQYKLLVENEKIFESEKEKFLGLPFQMIRHQQYPVPQKGTWQYDLFEEIFGHPFSYGIDEVEVEEKIHKFNYEKFLHPSIIKKFNDGKYAI
jgi:dGTP triphosphohydrolase